MAAGVDQGALAARLRRSQRALGRGWCGVSARVSVAALALTCGLAVGGGDASAQPRTGAAKAAKTTPEALPHAPAALTLVTGERDDLKRAQRALEAGAWKRAARALAQADSGLRREAARVFKASRVGPERGSGPIGPFMERYVRSDAPVLRVVAGRFYLDATLYRAWVWACAKSGDMAGARRAMIDLLTSGQSTPEDRANAAALAQQAPSRALDRAIARSRADAAER